MEPHGLVQRQVGLGGHGVRRVVLLGLSLQLRHDGLGPRTQHRAELLLGPLLLLQHCLDLLQENISN